MLTCDRERIKDICAVTTVVGGRVVHECHPIKEPGYRSVTQNA
jgi:hypothetical protein